MIIHIHLARNILQMFQLYYVYCKSEKAYHKVQFTVDYNEFP